MKDTFYVAKQAGDARFLRWLHDRLEFVHGENPNVDYMHRLRDFVAWFEGDPLAERDAAVEAEREACAQIVDRMIDVVLGSHLRITLGMCAADIRARPHKPYRSRAALASNSGGGE